MTNLTYKILEQRQKMYIKAYAILCGLLFIAVAAFTYLKWSEYIQLKIILADTSNLTEILTTGATSASANYFQEKESFDELSKSVQSKLKSIFPEEDDYTALTRQLDSYEEELAKTNNPFEISHIDYEEADEQETYAVLPLRMSIRSSSDNFRKFLHMVENSGSLDDEVRLMDITSIRLNFENSEEEDLTSEIINFTVQINAYFQKKQ